MTRAGSRPIKRVVEAGALGPQVVEIRGETLTIRPYRSRSPLFEATYSEIVHAVLLNRAPKHRTRRPRRGIV